MPQFENPEQTKLEQDCVGVGERIKGAVRDKVLDVTADAWSNVRNRPYAAIGDATGRALERIGAEYVVVSVTGVTAKALAPYIHTLAGLF
tara:strand:- start:78 stop:347 length:270 start_codon:yes stop_codon:yes gene_type:complete